MPKLNWKVILYNLRDAREQLQEIEALVDQGNPPSKIEFQKMMEHALHHFSFAWNTRQVSTKKYANLMDQLFNEWSKFPKELKPFKIKAAKKQ